MEILQLTREDALKLYPGATSEIKAKFEKVFGSLTFKPRHYTDFKSFEDCAEAEGLTADEIARYKTHKNKEEEIEHHFGMLRIIAKALRGSWVTDYSNTSQSKYYPWFKWSGGGFVFDNSYYVYDFTFTFVGSRLCFPDRAMSDYFGTQFLAIHKVVLEN